jgi:hypothetical protein
MVRLSARPIISLGRKMTIEVIMIGITLKTMTAGQDKTVILTQTSRNVDQSLNMPTRVNTMWTVPRAMWVVTCSYTKRRQTTIWLYVKL